IDHSSTNAFLVLDRNGNGVIDNGTEMFGDLTPQPDPPKGTKKNGFNALTEYDLPENGGNGDGVISAKDQVFSKLRLMRADMTLHKLDEYGVTEISLDYKDAHKVDQYGNIGEYKSSVTVHDPTKVSTVAYDWLLQYSVTIPVCSTAITR
ncbi:MAG: hypothetical protein WAN65_18945, partial [Candidatus Sulfotelmatobacter sp.]